MRTSYQSLLRTAGFTEIDGRDDTQDYRATQLRWMAATERYEHAMRAAMGDAAYDERLVNRRRTLRAIDEGLLARFRYSATR